MPQSLAQVWVHIVFSTKDRRPFLQHTSFQEQMFRMLAHQIKEMNCISASVGGHIDHVHVLVGFSRTVTIAKLVENIKIETSKWAKRIDNGTAKFSWQSGYGAFSVSHSMKDDVDQCIRNQAAHHAKMGFKEEFRAIYMKHGVDFDERYVWD